MTPPPSPAPLRYPASRVCIVLLTGLGDVVNGLPLVNALKLHDPSCHVTWVVEPMPSGVLLHHPAVDDVVVYDKKRGWRGIADLRRDLAGRRFDLTINLNVYFKSVWPTLLSAAPHRLGFERGRASDGVWLAANHHLAPAPRAHTLDMFLEFAAHLGLSAETVEWRLPMTDAERREQEAFFAPLRDRPVVGIVPASANRKKDWFPDRYARMVDTLERDFGFRTVLVGGPGERETALAREIVDRASAKPAWGLGDGIRRLVWMVDGCDLLIAPDTGPVHIARALEVPVIGLYGHTNPWRVGPYREYQDLWVDRYTDEGEAPDPSRFDPKLDRMERITVDDVLERVRRAAARYPSLTR
ncbi:MAG: glycosyl transferase family 9 [Gemmatimonadetes bacterium]|nr:glycosyl transferase family 9 [Gemmatimonadota bacterium]